MKLDPRSKASRFIVAALIGAMLGVSTPAAAQPTPWLASSEAAPDAGQPLRQVLRSTNVLDHWELIASEQPPRIFVELERFELLPLPAMEDSGLRAFFSAVLVGQLGDEEGYVVGVVGEAGSAGEGSDRTFTTFARPDVLSHAHALARDFAAGYNRQSPGYEPPAEPIPLCDCEDCGTTLVLEQNSCAVENNLCIGEVVAAGLACALVCAGNPICEGLCAAAVIAGILRCNVVHARCNRDAIRRFQECEANCNP